MHLEDTIRDLAPRLLRFSLGQTGDAALAEEAAQEALTALVQRWRRQGPPDCPDAFAFAIARRRAFRLCLKRRLLEPLQLRVVPSPDRAARKTLPMNAPIDLKVTKAEVRQLLQTFGQILSVEADVDPRITGEVTFELDNIPVGQALDKVCAMVGCEWKIDNAGASPVLRFTAKK